MGKKDDSGGFWVRKKEQPIQSTRTYTHKKETRKCAFRFEDQKRMGEFRYNLFIFLPSETTRKNEKKAISMIDFEWNLDKAEE